MCVGVCLPGILGIPPYSFVVLLWQGFVAVMWYQECDAAAIVLTTWCIFFMPTHPISLLAATGHGY